MSFIQIKDVVKSFGDNTVLKNIHLDVEQGEMVTLLGPSGCGKSTLLRAIAGLNVIDSGSVFIDGKDVTAIDARHRQVGMVFQSYALFPNMTAAQNIAFGLTIQKQPIQQSKHITAIFVTHDQEEAMAISDRICVMHNGIIEQEGAPEDIYTQPKTTFVAQFIGHYNVLSPAQAAQLLGIPAPACDVVAIRPEVFSVAPVADGYSVTGRITRFSMIGSIKRYTLEGNGISVDVEFVNEGTRHRDIGQTLTVSLAKKDVLFIKDGPSQP